MKRMMKTLALVAVAAMGLTACQNDFEEQVQVKDSVVVNFVADSAESRTSVDTSDSTAPVFAWGENETFAVLEQTDALAEATAVEYTKVDEKANIKATFNANPDKSEYEYVTIYPASGYAGGAESIESVTLNLPSVQTMADGSYDPAADLMVSEVVTTSAQPSEAQMVRFTRLAAVVKMNVVGLEAGDKVESVTFEAEGQTLTGKIVADLNKPHEFDVKEGEGSNSVSVSTKYNGELYFTVLPATLEAGNAYTVTVITSKKIYIKKGVITEGKKLEFKAGMVTRFGVTLEGADVSDRWELVRDVTDLKEGDVVTLVAKNYNHVVGANMSTNYPKVAAIDVVKIGDYLYFPIATNETAIENRLQQYTLIKRDSEKNAFDFYNEPNEFYDDKTSGFICAPVSSSKYLPLQAYYGDNTLFYTEIDEETGVATLVAKDASKGYKQLTYDTSKYFCCYSENTTISKQICIYKLAGGKGNIPTVEPSITVPQYTETEEKNVVIAKDAVTEASELTGVTLNYVGEWTLDIKDDADWLTVAHDSDNNYLTYISEENTGVARYATVTISITIEGQTKPIATFKVLQKGEPIEVSIEEFVKKLKNVDVTYQLTGRLATIPTSKTSAYVLEEVNGEDTYQAKLSYLKTTGGTYVYESSIGLKVGDIVTATAVVSGTTKGSAGTSSYPSIYKGYYRVAASDAVVGYAGGSATINVAIESDGEIAAPATIEATIAENDFGATLSYSDGVAIVTFPENTSSDARVATVTFTAGKAVTVVSVTQEINPTLMTGIWYKVTDVKDLYEGDQVIIAAKDSEFALSKNLYNSALETNLSAKRDAATVNKSGSYLLDVDDSDAQQFVLVNGSIDGTFAFYDKERDKFIVSNSSTALISQPYYDVNSSYAITIAADGTATIANTASSNYPNNKLYYYISGTTDYFCSYNNSSSKVEYKELCIYKLAGVQGEVPVVKANFTVPTTDLVIDAEGEDAWTAVDGVVFNYTNGWNIVPSTEAAWLEVKYENDKVYYKAVANEGKKQTATVTITASRDGQEDIQGKFTVLQKGVPEPISIEEFVELEKDLNTTYILTGKVSAVSSSNDGKYTIKDESGNEAIIKYLYTEDGKKVYGNTSINLAVGDVVTVYTIVTTSTKGEGGSSTYHSIYKGHYNISAECADLVSYSGGNATINITKTGNLQPEGVVVKGTMNVNDYAELTYTDDAATATVTFAANNGGARDAVVTFTYGQAEVSVTVSQENNPAVDWYLVTANDLKAGDVVIIAATGMDYAISTASSSSNRKSTAITKNVNSTLDNVGEDVQKFVIETFTVDGNTLYAFKATLGSDENEYLQASSSNSNNMGIGTTLNDNGKWTIEIDSEGAATVIAQGTYSRRYMNYNNKVSSSPTFYCTSDGSLGKVCFYRYENRLVTE